MQRPTWRWARRGIRWKVISLLTDIIRSSLKEKVIRISLAALRVCSWGNFRWGRAERVANLRPPVSSGFALQNLMEKAPEVNLGPMMDVKLLNLVQTLSGRKWTDEDIVADLEVLATELQKNAHELTYAAAPLFATPSGCHCGLTAALCSHGVAASAQVVRGVRRGAALGQARMVADAPVRHVLETERAAA